jgi:hypothetical protein
MVQDFFNWQKSFVRSRQSNDFKKLSENLFFPFFEKMSCVAHRELYPANRWLLVAIC